MTIMSDIWIEKQCTGDRPMITPFTGGNINNTHGKFHPSYGLSSYGYDVRLGNRFKLLKTDQNWEITIDTREGIPEFMWEDTESDYIVIPPHGCALGYTLERVDIPDDIMVICMAKSSIARMFVQATVTPIEPGFVGNITIELHNPTPMHQRVYAGDGIMQLLFIQGNERCAVSYADRNGRYQNQPAKPVPALLGSNTTI